MRVCDHCGARATSQISFSDDHQTIDICESAKQMILAVISTPEKKEEPAEFAEAKKRGRPKKDE